MYSPFKVFKGNYNGLGRNSIQVSCGGCKSRQECLFVLLYLFNELIAFLVFCHIMLDLGRLVYDQTFKQGKLDPRGEFCCFWCPNNTYLNRCSWHI
jgi:hypothetical protein